MITNLLIDSRVLTISIVFIFLLICFLVTYIINSNKDHKFQLFLKRSQIDKLIIENSENRVLILRLNQKLKEKNLPETNLTFIDQWKSTYSKLQKLIPDLESFRKELSGYKDLTPNVNNLIALQTFVNDFINKHDLQITVNAYIHEDSFILCGENLASDFCLSILSELEISRIAEGYEHLNKQTLK